MPDLAVLTGRAGQTLLQTDGFQLLLASTKLLDMPKEHLQRMSRARLWPPVDICFLDVKILPTRNICSILDWRCPRWSALVRSENNSWPSLCSRTISEDNLWAGPGSLGSQKPLTSSCLEDPHNSSLRRGKTNSANYQQSFSKCHLC